MKPADWLRSAMLEYIQLQKSEQPVDYEARLKLARRICATYFPADPAIESWAHIIAQIPNRSH
jgi:hypothetical protein